MVESRAVVTSSQIREVLGLTRTQWARALNVSVLTVRRWEDVGVVPSGLAAEVMHGISAALGGGADPTQVANRVKMGVGSLICHGLLALFHAKSESSR